MDHYEHIYVWTQGDARAPSVPCLNPPLIYVRIMHIHGVPFGVC